ncbi:MAG: DUF1592 domain-containing protein [Planctomycetales bacterium]|nr:DUF1592 domain-containing protein [Planctomycetales bacterium]
MNRSTLWKLLAGWALLPMHVSAAAAADFDADVGPYFQKHCIACHGPDEQESEFRIDNLSKNVGVEDTALWAEIRERISSGEMPPEDVDAPPTAARSAEVVAWLTARIDEGESARMAKRDRVAFYRLSRDEYVHSIYDLLGVHFDATDPGGFTDDPEWRGFERLGSVLSLSASHIEKYMQAAETILAEAYPDKPAEPLDLLKPAVPSNTINEPYLSQLEAAGLLDKVRFDLWPQDKHRYSNPGRLPAAGVYEARIQLSGLKPAGGRAPRLLVYHTKLDRVLHAQDVVAPEGEPTTITFRTHLPEGNQEIQLINDVPGPSNLPRSGRHGRQPFVSIAHGRIPWQLKLTDEQGAALYPFLILDSAHWSGPIVTDAEQRLRDDYMPQDEGDLEQVRSGLARLARRAFRRPLRNGEIDRYVDVVRSEIEAGAEFRAAVKTGMLAILCSKSFLFLVEGAEDADRRLLDDWELASRLSYFLWSTMPDEQLFSLADNGTLHEPSVLSQQVARMLADPRAERFSDSFVRQWLRLRKVGMFPPDENLYPDYDSHLEQSMIGEPIAFFRHVLANQLSLREFLDSNWTMANPRLANYYGLDEVQQDTFQRVALRPEVHRGGLLTQAAILSLTSDGTRHRPVHRGVWISESIFGKSPPPPPANVEPIEPNPLDEPKATLRMKLEAHQKNPNCAACHAKIDPLGLAFENYNAIGAWRTEEVVQRGTGSNPPVDPSGALPDGRTFANAEEFKQLLLADLDEFNATFIRKLATYGLRRTMTFEDRDELASIAGQSQAADYQVRAIVEAFVLSDLFRQR